MTTATESRPLWQERAVRRFPASRLPHSTDVLVVGAGITGLTAALLLKRAGKRVVVCDRQRIGGGETGHTSAHLTYVTDLRLGELVQRFGRDAASRVWRGGRFAIDLIESNVASLGIECGFRRVPGFLYAAPDATPEQVHALAADAKTAAELGFVARYLARGPVLGRPAVQFADQAVFHPLAYIEGLASAVHDDGSIVSEDSEVTDISDDPRSAEVNGQRIAFDHLVLATHVPMAGLKTLLGATLFQTKLYPYSSYVVGARIPRGDLAPGLYSDTGDPYDYLRVSEDADGRYAIFGGSDHKTGKEDDTDACFRAVEQRLHRILPAAVVDHHWSGQVIETNDGLPYMGFTSDRQFVATGFAGNGLTFGTLAGVMARDAVLDEPNPWQQLLDPGRIKLVASLGTLVKENLDYPYHLVLDRLREDRTAGPESVRPGEGRVLRHKGRHVACHRDDDGKLTMVDAVCTHLGCLVRWNGAEKTWDCPCHGSRFTTDGGVIGGPAEEPLERL